MLNGFNWSDDALNGQRKQLTEDFFDFSVDVESRITLFVDSFRCRFLRLPGGNYNVINFEWIALSLSKRISRGKEMAEIVQERFIL